MQPQLSFYAGSNEAVLIFITLFFDVTIFLFIIMFILLVSLICSVFICITML